MVRRAEMTETEKILLANNELANFTSDLQRKLGLTESEMQIACEMLLSTARHKVIVRNAYDKMIDSEKETPEEQNIEFGTREVK